MNFTLVLGILVLLVFKMQLAGTGKNQMTEGKKNKFYEVDQYFSLDVAKSIQGVCALFIILHHSSQLLNNTGRDPGAVGWFQDAGILFVGFFFFCSGYGLIRSTRNKEQYMHGFLRKRLSTILLPFYLINIMHLVYFLIEGMRPKPIDWFLYLTGLRMINANAWFAIAIFLFYIIFYLLFRFCKIEWISYVGMALAIIAYCVIGIYRGHGDGTYWLQGEWWYSTSPLLLVGMLWARFEKVILKAVQKVYLVVLFALAVGVPLAFQANIYMNMKYGYWAEYAGGSGIPERFKTLPVQVFAILIFVLFIVVLTMKVRFYNKAIRFLGELSFEIYLIHGLFLKIYRSKFINIESDILLILAATVTAVILGAGIHSLSNQIRKTV